MILVIVLLAAEFASVVRPEVHPRRRALRIARGQIVGRRDVHPRQEVLNVGAQNPFGLKLFGTYSPSSRATALRYLRL